MSRLPLNDWLDASFRGVTFHCQLTDDAVGKAVAVHEYPFRDGGEVDDMGRKARRHTLKALFSGLGFDSALKNLVEALEETGEGELVHPVYGPRKVVAEDYQVHHDAENPNSCTVDITFVESGLHNPFFAEASTAAGKASACLAAVKSALDTARALLSGGLMAWVSKLMSLVPGTGLIASVVGVISSAARFVADVVALPALVMSYLDAPTALVSQMESAAASVRDAQNIDLGDVSGRFSGWKRLSDLFKGRSSGSSPGPLAASGQGDAATSAVSGGTGKASADTGKVYSTAPVTATGAVTTAPKPGGAQNSQNPLTRNADTTTPVGEVTAIANALVNFTQSKTIAEVACEILEAEAAEPTLSPAEVEAIVNNTRERLQDTMDSVRVAFAPRYAHPVIAELRTAAYQVQELGRAVINARPPLVAHTLAAPANHHLLAPKVYGDYTRAGELLRLNPHIRTPNFLTRGQEVRIYAK